MMAGMMSLPKSWLLSGRVASMHNCSNRNLAREDVYAHRGEDVLRVAGDRLADSRLFLETRQSDYSRLGLDDAKVASTRKRRPRRAADRQVGIVVPVKIDQAQVVHLVDVVAGQNDHILGPLFFERVDVLIDGVGRALVPVLVDPLLRRHHIDKLAQLAAQKPRQPRLMCRSRLMALYCVRTSILRMPLFRQLESVKSMIRYRPPNGTAGLARSRVKGSRREPLPPASTTAKTFIIGRSLHDAIRSVALSWPQSQGGIRPLLTASSQQRKGPTGGARPHTAQ